MILLVALAMLAPHTEAIADAEVRAAVVGDLMIDAGLGNADPWFWSMGNRPPYDPEFAVLDVSCRPAGERQRCRFTLRRKHVAAAHGTLREWRTLSRCTAMMSRTSEFGADRHWRLQRLPPGRSGHSRSTMHCREV